MKLTYIYALIYMQAPSEASIREELQIGGPPFTSHQVCLCRSLSLYVCVHISRSSNIQYVCLIWTCNMFYAGFPWWIHSLAIYSLSCRGRFAAIGIIWNMILIMFCFVWKFFFVTYISLSHMLLYVGTCCDSGAWRAPKWGCCQPTP